MDRRREELRAWFGMHPHRSGLQAITDLGYSYPDYMHVVADSIRIDLARETGHCQLPNDGSADRHRTTPFLSVMGDIRGLEDVSRWAP